MTTPDTVERELAAIDDALESGAARAADPRELELQQLALALRAEAPEPTAAFESELDRRAEAGFPRKRRTPRLRSAIAPAVAAALLALVASVALLTNNGRDSDNAGGGDAAAPLATPELSQDESGGGAQDRAAQDDIAPAPGATGIAPGESDRRIERAAALTLAAPGDEIDSVADGIVAVADRHRGFVLRSSVTSGDEGPTGGSFDLRIPSRRLQDALRDLSGLAEVRARTQSGEDITRAFVSTEDRLDAARAERRGLLRRLENADTDEEAAALRRRIDLVSAEIRGLRGQLRELRERTNYAAVAVTLTEDDGASRDEEGGGGGIGSAFDDAVGSLAASMELAIRALGVLIPVGVVAALLLFARATFRRHRREATLG